MSIILFLVVLLVLVLVHEWGHFVAAKKTGMRVDEFGFGFPPKLYGIKKGETEYTFNALPIGGFVRIYGENKEELVDGEINHDSNRAFSARPKWAQAVVLIAGVLMNVLLAWLLFTIVLMIGVPTAIEESVASSEANLYVADTITGAPAEAIPVNSILVSAHSGEDILYHPKPSTFSEFVTEHAPNPITITYQYAKEVKEVTIVPTQGLSPDEPERYLVGASLTLIEMQQRPVHIAIRDGFTATIDGLVGITVGLYTLISQSLIGQADFSSIAGPVGIVNMVGDAASFGITTLLSFVAIISLNLAIINILPFPALDGGRLLFVLVEATTRKEIPPVWAGRLNVVGFALLMLLMVAVTYNDVMRIL
jgi:regulator of sigma E protease